jgi:hypothetical protein
MATKDFFAFGGIRNTLSDERLGRATRQGGGQDQRTDLTEAVNIDLDDSGRASRRAGQTRVVTGACHSIWCQDGVCLFVRGGSLRKLRADFLSMSLADGLSDEPMRYVSVNGTVYWSNGTQNGVVKDEVCGFWGIEPPRYQPETEVIQGSLSAGTYQYAITYLREDGQESGTGLAARIDLADASGLRFFWDAPDDASITHVAIYLTEPNGEVLYRAFIAPVDTLLAWFTGGHLALPLASQWLDAPPAGQDLAYSNGRIYIAVGEFIYATTALGYGYVDMRDYLALDGTTVRFVLGVEGGLYAGTEKAVYFLKGNSFAEMEPTVVAAGYGVAGSAIQVDGFEATGEEGLSGKQCALFASALGLYFGTPDGSVSNLTLDRYHSKMDRIGSAVLRTSQTLTQYLLTMRE